MNNISLPGRCHDASWLSIQSRTYTGFLEGRRDAGFAVTGLSDGVLFFVGLAVWTGRDASLPVMGAVDGGLFFVGLAVWTGRDAGLDVMSLVDDGLFFVLPEGVRRPLAV